MLALKKLGKNIKNQSCNSRNNVVAAATTGASIATKGNINNNTKKKSKNKGEKFNNGSRRSSPNIISSKGNANGKYYLIQYMRGDSILTHTIIRRREICWPLGELKQQQKVLIRDGKSNRLASILYFHDEMDQVENEMKTLQACCFHQHFGKFNETPQQQESLKLYENYQHQNQQFPHHLDSIHQQPSEQKEILHPLSAKRDGSGNLWLLLQYSKTPSTIVYEVVEANATLSADPVTKGILTYRPNQDGYLSHTNINYNPNTHFDKHKNNNNIYRVNMLRKSFNRLTLIYELRNLRLKTTISNLTKFPSTSLPATFQPSSCQKSIFNKSKVPLLSISQIERSPLIKNNTMQCILKILRLFCKTVMNRLSQMLLKKIDIPFLKSVFAK